MKPPVKRDKCCPHCGSEKGLYSRYTYSGIIGFYDYNGQQTDESFDCAGINGGKKMYCQACNEFVCYTSNYLRRYAGQEGHDGY